MGSGLMYNRICIGVEGFGTGSRALVFPLPVAGQSGGLDDLFCGSPFLSEFSPVLGPASFRPDRFSQVALAASGTTVSFWVPQAGVSALFLVQFPAFQIGW